MKLSKFAKHLFWIELIFTALLLLGGFYEPAIWLFGLIYSLPLFILITLFLFSIAIYYRNQADIRKSLEKMVFISLLLLIPAIILIIYLIQHPFEIPID